MYMQLKKSNTNSEVYKVKDHTTFLDFATAKSPIISVKSISLRLSDSMLMIARLTSLPESWMVGCDFQLARVWKKNARRCS